MKITDRKIAEAMKMLNSAELPMAWQADVLQHVRRNRQRKRLRWFAAASAAAAAAISLPVIFTDNESSTPYIYTPEYYASLPTVDMSIKAEIEAILLANENEEHFFEPYEPLPE